MPIYIRPHDNIAYIQYNIRVYSTKNERRQSNLAKTEKLSEKKLIIECRKI